MLERCCNLSFTAVDPTEGNALGALNVYFDAIFDMTIIAVSAAPETNDAGATMDIDDDGSNVITAIDISDQNVPGTWKSAVAGGTNDPVFVAAGSKLGFDFNSAAAGTAVFVNVWYLIGEVAT